VLLWKVIHPTARLKIANVTRTALLDFPIPTSQYRYAPFKQ